MTDPARLARWWGPAGFTNEVTLCDLRPGGRWLFVMHSPDGKAYPNENHFEVLDPPQGQQGGRFVLRHVLQPLFRLTLSLEAECVTARRARASTGCRCWTTPSLPLSWPPSLNQQTNRTWTA